MGCLKLQYHPQMQVLRIRESERSREEKSAQWFTTPDPLAELDPHISPYAYCRNNPLKYTDPDGRHPVIIVGGIVIGAGEVALISMGVITTGIILHQTQSGRIGLNPSISNVFRRSTPSAPTNNATKPSPGLTEQGKRERAAKEGLDKNQANVAKSTDTNVTGTMPDGNPSPKRDPKNGGVKTVVAAVGAAAAAVKSVIEGTEPQETETPQEPAQQPEVKPQEPQQQQNNSLWQNFLDLLR